MKYKAISILGIFLVLFSLCSCGNMDSLLSRSNFGDSSFSIRFIDVGQGDSALIECDGHHMLIDGGDKKHGDNVYYALEHEHIQHLDILVVSHFHTDHYAGLEKALTYVSKIDLALSNNDTYLNGKGEDEDTLVEDSESERDDYYAFSNALHLTGAFITVPRNGDKYQLGSATVEVVDVASEKPNDSLVLLVTYKNTRFLFTGDIEENAQKRIADKYANQSDKEYKIDLIKMPHHGSYTGSLYQFFRTFMPDYVVISVGADNRYGHPDQETLDMMSNKKSGWNPKVYRTDQDGDIVVFSDGKNVSVKTSR